MRLDPTSPKGQASPLLSLSVTFFSADHGYFLNLEVSGVVVAAADAYSCVSI